MSDLESLDIDGPDVHDDPSWSPESATRFARNDVVREQAAAFHDWHKLVTYPETCEVCRYRAALEAILDAPTNATVLNVQFIAKEALRGTK